MDVLKIQIFFESKSVEVDEKLLGNILEFAIRSLYGLVGGSLIHYEVLNIIPDSSEILLKCGQEYTSQISSALTLINTYGISRIKSQTSIIDHTAE